MLVAESTLTHISQLDGAFGAGIHEPVATDRMELGGRDDFSKLLHVRRFDVNDVEALILDIEVPQVDPEVVTADEGFLVAVDGDAVDVIGVRICVRSSRNRSYNSVVMSHSGEFEL